MHITSTSKATSVIIRGIPYLIKSTLKSLTKSAGQPRADIRANGVQVSDHCGEGTKALCAANDLDALLTCRACRGLSERNNVLPIS